MNDKRRMLILVGVAACGAVLAVAVRFLGSSETTREVPKGAIYYSGPMKAKGLNSWGAEDGKSYTKEQAEADARKFQEALGR